MAEGTEESTTAWWPLVTQEQLEKYGPGVVGLLGGVLLIIAFAALGATTCTEKCSSFSCEDHPALCNVLNCTLDGCIDRDTLTCVQTYPSCLHSDSFYIVILMGILLVAICAFNYCYPMCKAC